MFTANQRFVVFLALGLSFSSLAGQASARPHPRPLAHTWERGEAAGGRLDSSLGSPSPKLGGKGVGDGGQPLPHFVQADITTTPSQIIAQKRKRKRFVPPKLKLDRGIPTAGRSHNASRGCQAQQGGPGLTLLVPESVETATNSRGEEIESRYGIALSATAQPVFWAYVAVDDAAEEVSLEFVLRDGEGRKLYREMLAVPEQSGMVRIAPEAMPPLEAGVDYHWFLKQKSRCDGLMGLVRENGEAWVRYEPAAVGESDEETGYWYDILDEVADDAGAFAGLVEAIGLGRLL